MKKVLLLFVLLAFAAVAFVACSRDNEPQAQATPTPQAQAEATVTPDPAVADDIPESWLVPELTTIRLATSMAPNWGHPSDGMFWEWMQEYTNVAIDWTVFLNAEAPEQFALMMAARDLPDAFIGQLGGGTDNILLYGVELGVYIPLNDLIQSYAPNFLRRAPAAMPDIMSIITAPDGNIYSMPMIGGTATRVFNTTAINQTWLDNLGLEVPRTIEEVEEVLIAFRDGDPNGDGSPVIPLSFMFSCWGAADHGPWFGPFGAPLTDALILIENGQVTFQGAQEYFRDGARWLASLYAQGLVDLEVFTYDEPMYRARAGADPVVFGIWSSWSAHQDSGTNNHHFTTLLPPIYGPAGAHQLWEQVVGINRDMFSITIDAADPGLLMRWVDVLYRDLYTSFSATMGMGPDENMAWFIDENNYIHNVDPLPEEHIRGMQQLPFVPSVTGPELEARQAPPEGPGLQRMNHQNYVARPYAENFFNGTWNRWPNTFMLPEEADELSFIDADLIPFANRMLASWIAGERNVDDDWEQYLRDLDAYGLQRWLQIRQGVYDRFLAGS